MADNLTKECAICRNTANNEIVKAKEMVLGTREVFSYLLCGDCGTLALLDPPADIGKYYQDYYSLSSRKARNASPLIVRLKEFAENNFVKRIITRHILTRGNELGRAYAAIDLFTILAYYLKYFKLLVRREELLRFLAVLLGVTPDLRSLAAARCRLDSAILDVGCGDGKLVSLLSDLGFTRVLGVDPHLVEGASLRNGNKIVKGSLSEVSGEYDVIMFHHSFEHVADPRETIARARRLLKPDGVIILRFPNIDSIEFRKFRENWWGIHAPRHYFLFSSRGLEKILAKNELHVSGVYCDSSVDHYLYSTEYSLNIDDRSPLSFRNKKFGLWSAAEVSSAAEKAKICNKHLVGDWICYFVKHRAAGPRGSLN